MGQSYVMMKAALGGKCIVCRKKKPLEAAHVPAKSKGGTATVPMCHDCHVRHDQGKLTRAEQKRLGYKAPSSYTRARPKREPSSSLFDL